MDLSLNKNNYLAAVLFASAAIGVHANNATEFVNTIMALPIEAASSNLTTFSANHVPASDFYSEIATNTSFRGDEIFVFSATNNFDVTDYSYAFNYINEANYLRWILQRSGRIADSAANCQAQSNYYYRLRQLVCDIDQSCAITNQGIDRRLYKEILRAFYTYPVLNHAATIESLTHAITNEMTTANCPPSLPYNELINSIVTNEAFGVLGVDVPYYDRLHSSTGHVDLIVSTQLIPRQSVLFLNCRHYYDETVTAEEIYTEGYVLEALMEGVLSECGRHRRLSLYPITLLSPEQAEQLHAQGGTIRGSGLLFVKGTPLEIVKKLARGRF